MATDYSVEDLLEFLGHASERGLLPAATAQALAVAVRNVFGVLTEAERKDVRQLDLADVIKRFTNKRAKDFTPRTLKEYGNRIQRAVDHYTRWRADPSNFSAPTRATKKATRRQRDARPSDEIALPVSQATVPATAPTADSHQTSVVVRPGVVVTLLNVPNDLTAKEADRLARFAKMLAVE